MMPAWCNKILSSPRRRAALMLAAAVLSLPAAQAQTTAPAPAAAATSPIAYDVVTIKPDKSDSGRISININDNTFSASNVSVKMLLENTYGIKDDQIFGLPKWAEEAHFDLTAKSLDADPAAVRKLTDEQRSAMLRPVLADRFKLQVHTETKILPVYDLVVAKSGAKFKPAETDPKTGKRLKEGGWMSVRNTTLTATGVKLDGLTNMLAHRLHRTVVDKTGLTGEYDFVLNWTPEDGSSPSPEASDASLLTALEEQLGLKLESSKGPVDTLVVDHIDMPTED
jgi:uncharacterized protein (TIGR03435 family)